MTATLLPSDATVTFLTNGTFDDILDDPKFLPSLGIAQGIGENDTNFPVDPTYPLTLAEMDYMGGEGGMSLEGVNTPADMLRGHSAVLNGKKCHAPVIEFHFRNDATRHRWGTPATYETDLPLPEVVKPVADRCLALAQERLPQGCSVAFDETGYIDTNDRYAMWMFIPFEWIVATFKTAAEYESYLQKLFA